MCSFKRGATHYVRANQVQVWPFTVKRVDFWYCKFYHEVRKIWIVKSRGQGYQYFVLELFNVNASSLPAKSSPPFPALAGVSRSDSVASPSSLPHSYLWSPTDSFSLQVRPKNNQNFKN